MLTPSYNLLMLSGDNSIARGRDTIFNRLLERFSQYWQRIDVITPTAPDASARTIHGNVYVHPAPYHRLLQPLFIKRKGEQLLSERPYHLVTSHDFGFFYNGMGAWALLRGKDIPLVSEVHHVEGYPIAVNQRETLWRMAAQRYFPYMAQRATAFRVVNTTVGETLQMMGVPADKVRLLYSLYMDFNIYQPQPDITKKYDVLFVGRLASNKGILLLLDAIAQVKQTHPDVTLGIRGEGNLHATIDARIAADNLQENVIFVPRLEDTAAMATLYQEARVLVCASTVEGNPRVTIEAMACAVPVISTRVGIMPDVLQHGTNGYLVDWDAAEIANAIRRLLDDAALRTRIGNAGQESVQRFDAESMIREYALVYHDIIEAHKG